MWTVVYFTPTLARGERRLLQWRHGDKALMKAHAEHHGHLSECQKANTALNKYINMHWTISSSFSSSYGFGSLLAQNEGIHAYGELLGGSVNLCLRRGVPRSSLHVLFGNEVGEAHPEIDSVGGFFLASSTPSLVMRSGKLTQRSTASGVYPFGNEVGEAHPEIDGVGEAKGVWA
ncbi:hypothetical protein BDV97DRAFT_175413 [Delphinella strobiligena]|nr:hypothetical protein BDV97DRAFT_175413 [Delphinella strobiligena]